MAVSVESYPAFLQSEDYSAEITRRGTLGWPLQRGSSIGSVAGGLVGALSGVPDLQVTYSGGGLIVDVAGGEVVVPGSQSTTQSGYYLRASSGTLSPATASPSNPRIDLVYAQCSDPEYSGSLLDTVALATGTPTTGATLANLLGAPSVPTSAIAIAYILIPTSATTISATDILNEYPMAYFGPGIYNGRLTTTSITANSGDSLYVSSGSPTITAPVPYKNARWRVINYGSGVPVVSQNSGEVFYGLGLGSGGASGFSLGTYGAGVELISLDGVNWFVTAGEQDSGWNALTSYFQNSWTNAGGSDSTGAFRISGNLVRLKGTFLGGASNTEIFSALPALYRPTATMTLALAAADGTSGAYGYLSITSGGIGSVVFSTASVIGFDGMTYTND